MLWQTPPRARVAAAALVVGLAGASSGVSPAAVPLFASSSAAGTAATATSLTVARPAGAAPGHVLAAVVAARNADGVAVPAGWTEAVRTTCSGNDGITLTQAVLVRAAGVDEPGAYTFTTTGAGIAAAIVSYSGVDAQEPVLVAGGQIRRNSRLVTAPPVAPSVSGALLLAGFSHTGRSAITAPAPMTARTSASATPDVRLLAADELRAAAGPTGDRTAESTQTNTCAVGQHVALRPAPDPPASTSPPVVSGVAQEGAVLSATTGAWTWSPTAHAFQWQRSSGSDWADVAGATSESYAVGAADVGERLRAVVTASNSGGSGSAASAATAVVLPAPPSNTAPPGVSGVAREQETLSADPGGWTGSPTFAYEWQRSADNQVWEAAGTGPEYVLGTADLGSSLRVLVTATNAGGSAQAFSAPLGPVVASAPPSSLLLPTISGWQQEGETLSATVGTWSGSPTGFAYRWERSADGETWEDVGADGASLVLGPAEVGSLVRVFVTAANAAGSGIAASEPVGPVGPALPPASIAPPALLGPALYGVPLEATTGTWVNAPRSFAYRWLRSGDDGASWQEIEGAAGSAYVPALSDVGLRLAVEVTASNPSGSATAVSAATEPVGAPPPESLAPPELTGQTVEGSTLLASTGAWTNGPDEFTFAWQRCGEAGCEEIRWETSPDYTLRDDDVGFSVRALVTASNPSGSATAISAPTATILPLPPVNESPPTLAGFASQGETLTASTGDWDSSAAVTYAHRWQRSDDGGVTWTDVPGADGPSYLLVAGDVGAAFRAVVGATNAGGSTEAASAATNTVTPPGAPTVVVPPVISGVVQDRGRLNALTGTWSGSPTFTFAWQRSNDGGTTWTTVPRGTTSRYTAVTQDVGKLIRVVLTARNQHGTAVVAAAPWLIHPSGNRLYLANTTWYCDEPVDLDLVKVTIVDGRLLDAVRFDNCSGRVGRVEIDTNGIDGLKVRNTEPVAHDLTIESGYVRCTGHPEGAHQDGIQVLGGARVTFRNLVVWCGGPDPTFGDGVNSSALIATGGAGAATIPTDIVIEHSVMGPGTANGVLVEGSLRSGIRSSVACPDWTLAGGPVLLGAAAVEGIDLDNEKPDVDDPRCASFEAALAWAAGAAP